MSVSLSSSSKPSKVANPSYTPIVHPSTTYTSFTAFYHFYLGEHSVRTNRIFHIVGTFTAFSTSVYAALCTVATIASRVSPDLESSLPKILRPRWGAKEWSRLAIITIVQGYAWAWFGHGLFEGNRPATFKVSLVDTNETTKENACWLTNFFLDV